MRETSVGCLLYVPQPGTKPATRFHDLAKIEPVTFGLQEDAPTNWATPARARSPIFNQENKSNSSVKN